MTSSLIGQLAEERLTAAKLAQTLKNQQDMLDLHSKPIEVPPAHSFLSTPEILELDRLTRQEASYREEARANFVSMAQWLLLNRSVPSTPDAGAKLSQWCEARRLSLTHTNLDAAYSNLLASGDLTPNYSKTNAAQHDQNVEQLRAMGIEVNEAPDPRTATAEEINNFLRSQPPPSLDNLLPHVASTDPFDLTLDELNALNRVPEVDPWS